jgi:hypothetical protein
LFSLFVVLNDQTPERSVWFQIRLTADPRPGKGEVGFKRAARKP